MPITFAPMQADARALELRLALSAKSVSRSWGDPSCLSVLLSTSSPSKGLGLVTLGVLSGSRPRASDGCGMPNTAAWLLSA